MLFRWLLWIIRLVAKFASQPSYGADYASYCFRACRNVQSVSVRELDRKMMSLRATLDDLERTRAKLSPDAESAKTGARQKNSREPRDVDRPYIHARMLPSRPSR